MSTPANPRHASMDAAVEEAKQHIREMKRVSPYIYLEHGRLIRAQLSLKAAKEELARAEAAWEALGK